AGPLRSFVGVLAADSGQTSCRDPHDALAKPLEAEREQQRADDQAQRSDWYLAQGRAQHDHHYRQHAKAGGGADQRRPPAAGGTDADHDRHHFDRLHGRGEEGRDQDGDDAGHRSTLPRGPEADSSSTGSGLTIGSETAMGSLAGNVSMSASSRAS